MIRFISGSEKIIGIVRLEASALDSAKAYEKTFIKLKNDQLIILKMSING